MLLIYDRHIKQINNEPSVEENKKFGSVTLLRAAIVFFDFIRVSLLGNFIRFLPHLSEKRNNDLEEFWHIA